MDNAVVTSFSTQMPVVITEEQVEAKKADDFINNEEPELSLEEALTSL